MNSIVGLFTDVLPAGGVQRASRHVAAVAAKFVFDRGMSARFLSLNDPQGLHIVHVGSLEFSVSGYAGSKIQFALAALRAAGRKPALVIALHPHFAPIVWAMSAAPRGQPSGCHTSMPWVKTIERNLLLRALMAHTMGAK